MLEMRNHGACRNVIRHSISPHEPPSKQKGCRLQSDMPQDCASGMEGHGATRRESFSRKLPGRQLRVCLPPGSGAGAQELKSAESAEAHLTRETVHTNADRLGQKGGDHLSPPRRRWELPRCRAGARCSIIRPHNVLIQTVTDYCTLQTF